MQFLKDSIALHADPQTHSNGNRKPAHIQMNGLASDVLKERIRLRNLRENMRERLQNSPLLNAPRYVQNLEANYRHVWQTCCNQP